MTKAVLSNKGVQDAVARLFPKDPPMEGGQPRLDELNQEIADANPFTGTGRKSKYAAQIMKLAREYRQVSMGMET
mgnify:CR=1 FL=1